MKLALKIILKIILALIIIFILFFIFDNIYLAIQNNKFNKTKIGMKMEDVRKIVGKPDEIKPFDGEIMEVYYYFPMAEARFFYTKKDSILTQSWRTDSD